MSKNFTLSKSDFQLASTCSKKLVYKKLGYPTSNDTNEYMKMLAKGGYVVGMMATLMYPDGIEITGNTKEAIERTNEYLKQEDCVLFEAAIQSGAKLIRVDILEKKGDLVKLIEVKAKSHDTEDEPAKQKKLLEKYIEDVAFQYNVISEAFPEFKLTAFLLMPDKAKKTSIDGLAGWFSLNESIKVTDKELEELPAQQKPRFNKPDVIFKFENDPNRDKYIQDLIIDGILQEREVTTDVIKLQDVIKNRSNAFINILKNGITSNDYKIDKSCKDCEFKCEGSIQNGYKECWGTLADSDPHIFELYHGGTLKNDEGEVYLNQLIDNKQTSLFDINPEFLKKKDGTIGSRNQRQLIQLNNTANNSEWVSNDLKGILTNLKYPLHFIDFETYTGALPFNKGMRPYELIAFQWSCHTIKRPGDTPIHSEWISTNGDFPNFTFAESLMNQIGNAGTPLMWATHENTVLRGILKQMEIFGYTNKVLSDWLIGITSDSDKKNKREGRLVDMNDLTFKHYFHPFMKGKTSIKKVLPAIWNNFPFLHDVPFFKEYSAIDFEGGIIDPYDTLKSDQSQIDEDDAVAGGTEAMRAYQRIRFDDTLDINQKNEIKRQLIEYCKLDTMAMVIIAHHWGLK
jgi:hypothetical protein